MAVKEGVEQLFSIETLRELMMRAYLKNDLDEALRISQLLDNHLVSVQRERIAFEN